MHLTRDIVYGIRLAHSVSRRGVGKKIDRGTEGTVGLDGTGFVFCAPVLSVC